MEFPKLRVIHLAKQETERQIVEQGKSKRSAI